MSIKTDIVERVGPHILLGDVYIFYAQFGLSFVGDDVVLWVNVNGVDRKQTYPLTEFINFDMAEILEIANSMKQ
jgi:hypothetical protein